MCPYEDIIRAPKGSFRARIFLCLFLRKIGGNSFVERPFDSAELGSHHAELGSHHVELGSHDVELGSHGVELGSRDVELGSRDVELGSRDVELGSHGVELGSHGVELGSRDVELGSHGVERERVIYRVFFGGPARAFPEMEKVREFTGIYFIINYLKNNLKL